MATIPPQIVAKPSGSLESQTAAWKAIGQLFTAYAVLLAKLDADGGVTDTTYVSLCTPANVIGDK